MLWDPAGRDGTEVMSTETGCVKAGELILTPAVSRAVLSTEVSVPSGGF